MKPPRPEWLEKEILVLGCGNILLGDDGFGPRVAQLLQEKYHLPDNTHVLDVGSSLREVLFDIVLSEKVPRKIVLVDSFNDGKSPGEVFELHLDQLSQPNTSEFSIHQVPSVNLLNDLRDHKKIEIHVVAAQIGGVCDEINIGLSPMMEQAAHSAALLIFERHLKE